MLCILYQEPIDLFEVLFFESLDCQSGLQRDERFSYTAGDSLTRLRVFLRLSWMLETADVLERYLTRCCAC
jgi:hypothetical protein